MGFDYRKLRTVQNMFKRAQFVPPDAMGGGMPPSGDPNAMPPPGAGGVPPPEDPAAMGGMPPPPMDPSMMGAPPVDPAMVGGMPPPPMDPSMTGGGMPPDAGAPGAGDISPTGEPYMKITPSQLSKLFKQFAEVFKSVLGIGGQPQGAQPAQAPAQPPASDPALVQQLVENNAKLDALLGLQ